MEQKSVDEYITHEEPGKDPLSQSAASQPSHQSSESAPQPSQSAAPDPLAQSGASGLSRRGFVAGLALAASAATAATATGCVPAGSGDSDPSVSTPGAANLTPGTYTGEAPGHRGTLRVEVTVSADRIENINFLEAVPRTNEVIPPLDIDPFAIYAVAMLNDAPQILDTVIDRLGERIVEHQSLKVDAICGATLSSFGYVNAVKDALAQAGGDLSVFEVEVPGKAAGTDAVYEGFDVIVVGGGASGTTAAAAATAQGARVLLIEKSARIGGCGSMSSGVHVTDSRLQKEAGIPNDNETFFPEAMRQGLWYPKAPLVSQFLSRGGEVVDFLVEKGGFEFRANPTGVGYAKDSIVDPMAHDSWQRVADTVDTVLLETTVTGLIQSTDGTVTGVVAQSYDGTQITADGAKSVIIATGGFMNNEELQQHYNHAFFSTRFSMQQDIGEGLQLMLGAGAHDYHVGGMNIHITQPIGELDGFDDFSAMIPYTLHAAPNMLRVNQRGERFSSETMLADNMVGNGNYLAAQGRHFFTIVSAQQMETLAQGGLAATGLAGPVFAVNFNFYPVPVDYAMEKIEEVMEAGVAEGFIIKGESFETLAEAAGFKPDVFRAHIERYEAACAAGFDDLYYKDPALLLPLGSGPYYAIINEHCPYSTMGGVEVDEQMRVLDGDGDAIPGLFAAGCETIGALYGGAAYSDLGGFPFGWSCFSGFATGASAAGHPL